MEARDQITEQFREAVRKSESEAFPAMEQVWERVTARLDEEEKETRKVIPFRTIGIAAAVLALLGIGALMLIQNNKDTTPETIVQQKAIPAPVSEVAPVKKTQEVQPEQQVVVKNNTPIVNNKSKHRAPPRLMQGSGTPVAATLGEPAVLPAHTTTAEPQAWTVKGKVLDEHGEGVPGASIRIMGTTLGTVTDYDGNYELALKGNARLAIDAIGYEEQQINTNAKFPGVVTTSLSQAANALAEVAIVQPYGPPITKEKYTGAADVITSKQIGNMPVSDFTRALIGAAPGVQISNGNGQPGSSPAIRMSNEKVKLKEVTGSKSGKGYKQKVGFFQKIKNLFRKKQPNTSLVLPQQQPADATAANTEDYSPFIENPFESPVTSPLSTFSIDVDNASYTNIRRMINNGQPVPKSAVRIEEMVNYFNYQYPQPQGQQPFSINTDYSEAPWNEGHKLLRIGLQGKMIPTDKLPPSNLVFLIDVSGSMSDDNKLPLLKASMKLLVAQLRKEDHVAIVVYAGAAGLVLPPTSGDKKEEIIAALDRLNAGGGTAGGQGITLAYKIAQEHFMKEGNNRVILATDGDFNIGASSDADMTTLIEAQRKSNIFLTCLGYGMGNYKDAKMELLADKGNGNYAYIDNIKEANRFLVKEFSGTMYSIAKDVKIQIEFNPQYVQSYRLIGYENRKLKSEDFANDAIDAGELGSGHKVTALYEIIPVGTKSAYTPARSTLRYTIVQQNARSSGEELATVKFRYKKPDGDKSIEMVHTINHKPVSLSNAGGDFKLAAAVAWFGLKLRDSDLVKNKSKEAIIKLAQEVRGDEIGRAHV